MIKDNLENAEIYFNISKNLQKGFEWLINSPLENLTDGKYLIEGENIFANIQSYETKDKAPFEAHRKYIDIQYMVKGCEKIGITNYKNCKTEIEYNSEKDIEFLQCNTTKKDFLTLNEKEFMVFFPQDAHCPALSIEENQFVKKIIVKVKID